MEEITRQEQTEGTEENYHRTKMQEEMIFRKLKEKGCRITKQRQVLLNVILQEECASCKEIYYKARKEDARIGSATVYRMINLLEEIGAISRKNMYTIPRPVSVPIGSKERSEGYRQSVYMESSKEIICIVGLDDHTTRHLSSKEWHLIMAVGLRACGYIEDQNISNIILSSGQEADTSDEA